jgi:hypothetical protein
MYADGATHYATVRRELRTTLLYTVNIFLYQ